MMKFHQIGIHLVQINRLGVWHGYTGCVYRETFTNEADALAWLDDVAKGTRACRHSVSTSGKEIDHHEILPQMQRLPRRD
jgi:hypothetical protein